MIDTNKHMSSDFLNIKKSLPQLGVGLGLRRELAEEILQNTDKIDFLEIIPEQYMGKGGESKERLQRVCAAYTTVSHSVNLSLGSTDDLDREYLSALKDFVEEIQAPWFSDHVCFSSLGQVYYHELLPVPFNREMVAHMAARIKTVKSFIDCPFLIENTTFYLNVPGSTMTEAQFLSELLEQADCGLLLDVNNVYVNAFNHRLDPYKFFDQIPIERAVQVHMAGHKIKDDVVLDTHGAPIAEEVFDLLCYALSKTVINGITIERDQNIPAFAELADELSLLKAIAAGTNPDRRQ